MTNAGQQVIVQDYDPAWSTRFQTLQEILLAGLGSLAQKVHHVGSTAVPGLAAKPIIDIDVEIASRDDLPEVVGRLGRLSYAHEGDLGIAGREAFALPSEHKPSTPHHLYVCAQDSEELARHLRFRDFLRERPSVAAEYAALKLELARRHAEDPAAYTEGKTVFIEGCLAAARRGW